MTKCPECGAALSNEKREISPGIYANVEVCPKCEDEWVDEKEYEELRSLFKRKVASGRRSQTSRAIPER